MKHPPYLLLISAFLPFSGFPQASDSPAKAEALCLSAEQVRMAERSGADNPKARDSNSSLKAGEKAPMFALPSLEGKEVALADVIGEKVVVLSFIPAAWTPVCSEQWPGYNAAESLFRAHDACLIGISTDPVPTLRAWTQTMGDLWFTVLSDFYPHGKAAAKYGILRGDGTAERAMVVIDRAGIIRFFKVYDIDRRPPLDDVINVLRDIGQ